MYDSAALRAFFVKPSMQDPFFGRRIARNQLSVHRELRYTIRVERPKRRISGRDKQVFAAANADVARSAATVATIEKRFRIADQFLFEERFVHCRSMSSTLNGDHAGRASIASLGFEGKSDDFHILASDLINIAKAFRNHDFRAKKDFVNLGYLR